MTNESEKSGDDAQSGADADRGQTTLAPPFDPMAFAQEVLGGRPSRYAGTSAVTGGGALGSVETPATAAPTAADPASRDAMKTLTDPDELETARLESVAEGSTSAPRPYGLLSLANARIPSNLPPTPRQYESIESFSAVDREWEELATSPSPPVLRDATSSPVTPRSVTPLPVTPAPAYAEPRAPSAQEMNDRVSLGDYTGALEVAEKLLEIDPTDELVSVCADSCRNILKQMYTTRIGQLDRVPIVMVARDQLRWLTIDHRAGFVLSLVDGMSSVEMILDVSGMPELDALRILSELAQQRIISFR